MSLPGPRPVGLSVTGNFLATPLATMATASSPRGLSQDNNGAGSWLRRVAFRVELCFREDYSAWSGSFCIKFLLFQQLSSPDNRSHVVTLSPGTCPHFPPNTNSVRIGWSGFRSRLWPAVVSLQVTFVYLTGCSFSRWLGVKHPYILPPAKKLPSQSLICVLLQKPSVNKAVNNVYVCH